MLRIKNIQRFRRLFSTSRSQKRFPVIKWTTGLSVGGVLTYDYIANDSTYSKAGLRFCRSMKTAALISNDYFWAMRKHSSEAEQDLKDTHSKSAKRLLETCLLNGGLYIKVGQGVSAINHMLPEEYITTLSQLQDKCLPETKEDVQNMFQEEFKSLPEDIFGEFDYSPVAAASLAQVFKAKLKSGEEVAVKVQYLDLEKRFPSDLGTMIFIQNIVEYFFKDYNFGWILKTVKDNLIQEMDFVNEGRNSEKCAENLKKFKFVKVPEVYWDFTTKKVLTMEWIDGKKITDTMELQKSNIKLGDIDLKLFKTFSDQIFSTGFVHADPHPGNILVRKGNDNKAELVILDHGLYENLPLEVREPLCEFWEATVLRDEEKMKSTAKELGIENHKNFAEVLFQTPFNIEGGGGVKTKLTDEDIAYMKEVGRKNFKLVMQTLKEMPKNMIFVIR